MIPDTDRAVAAADADRVATLALAEDGSHDLTTDVTGAGPLPAEGVLEFRRAGVFAGAAYAEAVARRRGCIVHWTVPIGAPVASGTQLGRIQGRLGDLLRAERPLLNLLQRASGIATLTRAFVEAVAGTPCRILHTRKTAPGLRALDVAAVIAGGGERHRLDLAHEVMIKDNHWEALHQSARSLADALDEARRQGVTALYVEVESLEQVAEACEAGATRLLVDNQTPATVGIWAVEARRRRPDIAIEATGGITLETARAYADAGADFLSVGALTHSVQAADIALEMRW